MNVNLTPEKKRNKSKSTYIYVYDNIFTYEQKKQRYIYLLC